MLGLMGAEVDVGVEDRGSTSAIGTGSCIVKVYKYLNFTSVKDQFIYSLKDLPTRR